MWIAGPHHHHDVRHCERDNQEWEEGESVKQSMTKIVEYLRIILQDSTATEVETWDQWHLKNISGVEVRTKG